MLLYALVSVILAIITMAAVMLIGLRIREKVLIDSIYKDHIFESEHLKEILRIRGLAAPDFFLTSPL